MIWCLLIVCAIQWLAMIGLIERVLRIETAQTANLKCHEAAAVAFKAQQQCLEWLTTELTAVTPAVWCENSVNYPSQRRES